MSIATSKFDVEEATRALANRVRGVLASANGDTSPRIVQVVVPVEEKNALAWLHAQPDTAGPKGFWSRRASREATAFWGAADVKAGASPGLLDEIANAGQIEAEAGVRYYGGMRFDSDAPREDVWRPFGMARFVLPRVELRTGNATSGGRLICHLKMPDDAGRADAILGQIEQSAAPTPPISGTLPRPLARTNRPTQEPWKQVAGTLLQDIRSGTLEKVVLARRADVTFDASPDLSGPALLARLRLAAPDGFHFLFQPEDGAAFLGASPERLVRIEGRTVWSEAVAGTRPRGASPPADRRLRRNMLESAKERREHALVVSYIRERLATLCTQVERDDAPQVLRLARAQHLHTHLRGQLRGDVSIAQVVAALHPTPAVNGVPAEAARQALQRHEPFDRGWYAGPVGWVGSDLSGAELAVALRSGLVRGEVLHLYSGAGLVEGSRSAREWEEVEQKIGDFVEALDL